MSHRQLLPYLDLHTAGEPFRLITAGFPTELPGATMEEKRQYAISHLQALRRRVLLEPRGHDDMYGGLLLPPVNPGSDLGMLFMMTEGFTTMCGHGVLCVARAAIELGLVPVREGINRIRIDAPSATVSANAMVTDGVVTDLSFENDLSCCCAFEVPVQVPGYGTVSADIGYGAAFMVFVPASELGISLSETPFPEQLAAAAACRAAVMQQLNIHHPTQPEKYLQKNGCCLILLDDLITTENRVEVRDLTVFGTRQFDRSPTGTGTSALSAILYRKGILREGMELITRGPSGAAFRTTVRPAEGGVFPTISSMAYVTGRGELVFEDNDPLADGFSAYITEEG